MKLTFRRISCIFTALIITVSSLMTVYAAGVDIDDMVYAAAELIYEHEGTYTSVNPNDYGAVSIGKVQWHAIRARNLLKSVVSADEKQAKSILGEALFNEIKTTNDSWNYRTFNKDEAKRVSELLGTEAGMRAQDELAYADIRGYIEHGMRLGITDPNALVYFADIENQAGSGGVYDVASAAASSCGGFDFITLDVLHSAAMDTYLGNYDFRRNLSYTYCRDLDFGTMNNDAIGNVRVYNVKEDGCTVAFDTDTSAVSDITLYVWSKTGDVTFSYSAKAADTVRIRVSASDLGYSGTEFGAKIMAFPANSSQPVCIYEDISFTLPVKEKVIVGDANGDGRVTTNDAKAVLRHIAGLQEIGRSSQNGADVNSDGRITTNDAKLILRYVSGLIKNFS